MPNNLFRSILSYSSSGLCALLRSLATIDIVFSLTLLILGLGIENVWITKSNQQVFFVPAECQIQESGTVERMIVFIIVVLVR
jgi:hypothetical protein